MKYELLEQIIRRIRADLACPRCQAKLHRTEVEVLEVVEEGVELYMQCPRCQVHMDILAQVERMKAPEALQHHRQARQQGSAKLSPEVLAKISTSLKHFKGKDMRDLFQS